MLAFTKQLEEGHPSHDSTNPGARDWLIRVEFLFLFLFAFFLPLREAPKTIFWAFYTVIWIVNRVRERDFGGPWGIWDTLSALLLGTSIAAAAFAGIRQGGAKEWLALDDLVMTILLFRCLSRAGYATQHWKALLVMLGASCMLTEIEGFWLWKVTRLNQALELKSVGHVNHSAIYLAICFGAAMSYALSQWRSLSAWKRTGVLSAVIFLLVGVLMSDSRGAIGSAVVLFFVILILGMNLLKLGKLKSLVAVVLLAGAIAIWGNGAIQKHRANMSANDILSHRAQIWNSGLVAWRANPVFGIGPSNFCQITEERLKTWLSARGKVYEAAKFYVPISHSHNVYINTLTERGIVGFAGFLAFMAAWMGSLMRWRPSAGEAFESFMFWGASFSGWLVTIVAGMVNTTLHHEHALLATVLLAGWLAWQKRGVVQKNCEANKNGQAQRA